MRAWLQTAIRNAASVARSLVRRSSVGQQASVDRDELRRIADAVSAAATRPQYRMPFEKAKNVGPVGGVLDVLTGLLNLRGVDEDYERVLDGLERLPEWCQEVTRAISNAAVQVRIVEVDHCERAGTYAFAVVFDLTDRALFQQPVSMGNVNLEGFGVQVIHKVAPPLEAR